MTAARSVARSVDGDRLDWICRRWYGELFPGAVEAVLAANPGLAALGPVLPAGVEIVMPDLTPPVRVARPIALWD